MLVERFEIVSAQGRGQYGCVYKALDTQLQTYVAIKVLNSALHNSEQAISSFKNELLLVRQLSHPNIIRVHEYYFDQQLHFITMDWIEGLTLEDKIAEKKLTSQEIIDIIKQLFAGLACADEVGIVHKDLKPDNILIDTEGKVYIADFGLAALKNNDNSQSIIGTPYYAAPEYLLQGKVNKSTDLYSLGVIIYQLCCHSMPFKGNSLEKIIDSKLSGNIKFNPYQARLKSLKALVFSMLAANTQSRPESVSLASRLFESLINKNAKRNTRPVMLFAAAFVFVGFIWVLATVENTANTDKANYSSIAILPTVMNSETENDAFTDFIHYRLSHVSNLRVIDTSRVTNLLKQLGLNPPLDKAKVELLSDLLKVDALISPTVIRTGGNSQDVQIKLIKVDGFNTNESLLLNAPLDDKKWNSVASQAVKNLKQALNLKEQAGKSLLLSSPPSKALFNIKKQIELGNVEVAKTKLQSLLAQNPSLAQGWLVLGELLLENNLIIEAEQAYSKVLQHAKPLTYSAKFASARLNDLAGKVELAKNDYLELIKAFPYNIELKIALAEFYFFIEQHSKAEQLLLDVVKLDPYHPNAWFMLGRAAFLQGDLNKAVDDYFVKALVTAKKLKNPLKEGEALNAFGVVYGQQGNTELAFDYYLQALTVRQNIGDSAGVATTMTNLASLYLAEAQYKQAEDYLEKSLDIYTQLGDQQGLSNSYNELGVLAEEQALYQKALKHYQDALTIRINLSNQMLQAESMNNIGFMYYMLLNHEHALVYWQQAEQLFQRIQFPIGIIHVQQNLAQIELSKGNWRNAFHLFNNTLKDASALNSVEETIVAKSYLAKLGFLQGGFKQSFSELESVYQQAEALNDVRAIAEFGLWLADWSMQLGLKEHAISYLEKVELAVANNGNVEYHNKHAFLSRYINDQLHLNNLQSQALVAPDFAHQSVYIRELIYAAREHLRTGKKDISAYLAKLKAADYELQKYQYIDYLELLAIQQFLNKQWQALQATLREAELLQRNMGGYWRSFQFDRLHAQLALANEADSSAYTAKVDKKVADLLNNLPKNAEHTFLSTLSYFELNDGFGELSAND